MTKLKRHEPMTLEEVAFEMGLTRERVRQIEAKALRKLRHISRSSQLERHGPTYEPRGYNNWFEHYKYMVT